MSHIPALWRYVAHKIDALSSLSTIEFIDIVGHYNQLASGQDEMEPEINSRGYSPEALAEMKQQLRTKFNPVESLGLRFTIPLTEFKSDILDYALLLFSNYERGVLPFPGSVSEQPAKIIEVFNVLYALRSEQEEKQRRKLERDVRNKHQSQSRAGR